MTDKPTEKPSDEHLAELRARTAAALKAVMGLKEKEYVPRLESTGKGDLAINPPIDPKLLPPQTAPEQPVAPKTPSR